MKTRASLLAVATSLLLAAPAHAATGRLDDPAGDATKRGLDVTRAVLDNGDDALVVRVRFEEVRRGDVVVSVDPRGDSGLRLVSRYRPGEESRDRVLPYAFTDSGDEPAPATECADFQVRWDDERDVVRLRLPSDCLHGGDYEDVRFAVLTERRGADSDQAPGTKKGVSAFVARG